jgi:hypothetical protein
MKPQIIKQSIELAVQWYESLDTNGPKHPQTLYFKELMRAARELAFYKGYIH